MVITTSNPFGYIGPSVILDTTGAYTTVPQDDVFLRDHDKHQLFSMLNLATSIDLHYLIQPALDLRDAVDWFKILTTHIHGRLNKDVCAAKKLLEDLKFIPSKTVRENVSIRETNANTRTRARLQSPSRI